MNPDVMERKHYKPEYEYDLDAFLADFDAYVGGGTPPGAGYTPKTYFPLRYPDPAEARYKLRRFAASVFYLQNHLRAFDEFAVRGQKQVLVSRPLVAGLWRYFARIPEEHLLDEPDEALILRLAREEVE